MTDLPMQRLDRVPPPLWPEDGAPHCTKCGAGLFWTGEKRIVEYDQYDGHPVVEERLKCPRHGHWLAHGFGHYSEWHVRRRR